jgi:hypothetical protein
MIYRTCTKHISFELDGLAIRTRSKYLPVVGITSQVPVRKICENSDVGLGMPF